MTTIIVYVRIYIYYYYYYRVCAENTCVYEKRARRRTSKLARGRCARVLCTSTAGERRRGGGMTAGRGRESGTTRSVRRPEAAPLSRAYARACPARTPACTLWECDQDSHGRPVTRRRSSCSLRAPRPVRPRLYKTRRALGRGRHSRSTHRTDSTHASRARNDFRFFTTCFCLFIFCLTRRTTTFAVVITDCTTR